MDKEMLLACLYLWGLNGNVTFNCSRKSYIQEGRADSFAHSTHTTHDVLLESWP